MLEKTLYSNENWTQTIIRIMLGIVIFPHGAQKLLGWFGGFGFSGTMGYFTGTVGLPWIIGFLVIIIEFFGSLMLIAGVLTRVNALAVFGLFVGIIFTAHWEFGFFMNWFGQFEAGQEGFEYHLLLLAMAAVLIIDGGGKYATDNYLLKKYSSE